MVKSVPSPVRKRLFRSPARLETSGMDRGAAGDVIAETDVEAAFVDFPNSDR